jgi:hypothetical protein
MNGDLQEADSPASHPYLAERLYAGGEERLYAGVEERLYAGGEERSHVG